MPADTQFASVHTSIVSTKTSRETSVQGKHRLFQCGRVTLKEAVQVHMACAARRRNEFQSQEQVPRTSAYVIWPALKNT